MTTSYKYGLVVRPTYDELMNQILEGDFIKPKKDINLFDATWLANTQEMSQFMKDSVMDLQKQESMILKEQLMEMKTKEISRDTGVPAQVLRAVAKKRQPSETMYYNMAAGEEYQRAPDDALEEMQVDEENRKKREAEKLDDNLKKVKQALDEAVPKNILHQLVSASSSSNQAPMETDGGTKGTKKDSKLTKKEKKELEVKN